MALEDIWRQCVTPVELGAISHSEVDSVATVGARRTNPSRGAATDDHDVAASNRPLALNTRQLATDVEVQVVAMSIGQRLQNADP